MGDTKIHWADKVWQPVTGCSKISAGCQNCYAEKMSKRLAGRYGYPAENPFAVTVHPDRLGEPAAWKKPQRVFVCSMGDLFHSDVSPDFLLRVFGRMNAYTQHTFLVLTKRPDNALQFCREYGLVPSEFGPSPSGNYWPANVWAGVTAENQEIADERIPILMQIPAAVKFVSVEPMIGPVDITRYLQLTGDNGGFEHFEKHGWGFDEWSGGAIGRGDSCYDPQPGLDWIICGGESAQKARQMQLGWAESLHDQCKTAGVSFFMKQMSGRRKAEREAIPAHIDVQQFPEG